MESIFVNRYLSGGKIFLLLFLQFSFYANGQDIESLSGASTDIVFRNENTQLSKEAKRRLDSIAIVLGSDTSLGVRLTVSYRDMCGMCGNRAWHRVEAIAAYLNINGVNQVSSISLLNGDTNKVEVSIVAWTNSSGIPPHPNLRKKEKVN